MSSHSLETLEYSSFWRSFSLGFLGPGAEAGEVDGLMGWGCNHYSLTRAYRPLLVDIPDTYLHQCLINLLLTHHL